MLGEAGSARENRGSRSGGDGTGILRTPRVSRQQSTARDSGTRTRKASRRRYDSRLLQGSPSRSDAYHVSALRRRPLNCVFSLYLYTRRLQSKYREYIFSKNCKITNFGFYRFSGGFFFITRAPLFVVMTSKSRVGLVSSDEPSIAAFSESHDNGAPRVGGKV